MWASISHMAGVFRQVLVQVWTFLVSVISSARFTVTFIISPTGGSFKATISFPLAPRFSASITAPFEIMICSILWIFDWFSIATHDNQ